MFCWSVVERDTLDPITVFPLECMRLWISLLSGRACVPHCSCCSREIRTLVSFAASAVLGLYLTGSSGSRERLVAVSCGIVTRFLFRPVASISRAYTLGVVRREVPTLS